MSHPILFFDGVCGLCNHFVNFLMSHDRHRRLRFATLQGEHAQKLVPAEKRTDLDTVILFSQGDVYERSQAALMAIAALGGAYRAVKILLWIPRPIRDWAYDMVAKNRYQIFGKKDVCRLPTPEERSYFLD